jgi:plastocyanin
MNLRVLAAAVVFAPAAIALPADAARPQARAAGGSVGIAEREFRISVYRRTVAPGTVRFNVRNFGEDVHDFAVVTRGGRIVRQTQAIAAGTTRTLPVRLGAGVYRLICTTADHDARGMHARIRVGR